MLGFLICPNISIEIRARQGHQQWSLWIEMVETLDGRKTPPGMQRYHEVVGFVVIVLRELYPVPKGFQHTCPAQGGDPVALA